MHATPKAKLDLFLPPPSVDTTPCAHIPIGRTHPLAPPPHYPLQPHHPNHPLIALSRSPSPFSASDPPPATNKQKHPPVILPLSPTSPSTRSPTAPPPAALSCSRSQKQSSYAIKTEFERESRVQLRYPVVMPTGGAPTQAYPTAAALRAQSRRSQPCPDTQPSDGRGARRRSARILDGSERAVEGVDLPASYGYTFVISSVAAELCAQWERTTADAACRQWWVGRLELAIYLSCGGATMRKRGGMGGCSGACAEGERAG
ncbi:uncharacterized protein BKA78DRAFT_145265 [Phyllosticta capitalensis]|uniref:uncharacterized protein n=1 Tax=Phyllosticta capitalensis TaxID=121624 RepID=UPI00313246B6